MLKWTMNIELFWNKNIEIVWEYLWIWNDKLDVNMNVGDK